MPAVACSKAWFLFVLCLACTSGFHPRPRAIVPRRGWSGRTTCSAGRKRRGQDLPLSPDPVDEQPKGVLAMLEGAKNGTVFPSLSPANFIAGIGAGIVLTFSSFAALHSALPAVDSGVTESMVLFENVLTSIEDEYVDPVSPRRLFDVAAQAMLRTLDPYTEFESTSVAQDMRESVSGKYGGVGLVIAGERPKVQLLPAPDSSTSDPGPKLEPGRGEEKSQARPPPSAATRREGPTRNGKNDGVLVVSAFEDYAFDRGLRVGDVIISVDGVSVKGKKVEDVRNLLRGSPDTTAKVVFERSARRPDMVPNPEDSSYLTLLGESRDGAITTRKFEVDLPRQVVKLRDLKLATLLDATGRPVRSMTPFSPPSGSATSEASTTATPLLPPAGTATPRSAASSPLFGYIQLAGFSQDAGVDVLQAYLSLETEARSVHGYGMDGVILDLRGNPGGLLTSAVDVASLFVPKGSDLVSAQGRGFGGVTYRSTGEPVRPLTTPLTVLVNGGTASAAEIVSGAVQDLDSGIILGTDRTFGKGLVQNVEGLPYNTALKLTVAKYYTPSGRCIQSTEYRGGGKQEVSSTPGPNDGGAKVSDDLSESERQGQEDSGPGGSTGADTRNADDEDGFESGGDGDTPRYRERKVRDRDRKTFRTKGGRPVRDGGGIEADVKVKASTQSLVEVLLTQEGAIFDFATEWCQLNAYHPPSPGRPLVTDSVYAEFKRYVNDLVATDRLNPEDLYAPQLDQLAKVFKATRQTSPLVPMEQLRESIKAELRYDLNRYADDIKAAVEDAVVSRYEPESSLLLNSLRRDGQVKAAVDVLKDPIRYQQILSSADNAAPEGGAAATTTTTAKVGGGAAPAASPSDSAAPTAM